MLQQVVKIAKKAGEIILKYYNSQHLNKFF